jgi:hypothetical protein
MRVIFVEINFMAMESIDIMMAVFSKENGSREKNMERVNLMDLMGSYKLDNGIMINFKYDIIIKSSNY